MVERIIELIDKKKWKDIRQEILSLNSVDTAELFKDLEDSEILILFRLLPKDIAAEVFSYLSGDDQMTIIKAITDKEEMCIRDRFNIILMDRSTESISLQ